MMKKVSNMVINIIGMFRHQNAALLIKIYHDSSICPGPTVTSGESGQVLTVGCSIKHDAVLSIKYS